MQAVGPRPTAYDEGALMTSQSPRRFHEQGFPLDRSEGNTSPGGQVSPDRCQASPAAFSFLLRSSSFLSRE